MVNVRSKSESKGQQILTTATKLFTKQGYSATSMDVIAKEAGVSKQTVYSHYGSKDELFAESIKSKCDSYQMIDYMLAETASPTEILLVLAKRFLAMITSKEALAVHKICAFESNAYPQLSELFYQEGPERLTDEVTKLMKKLHDDKKLHIVDPKYAAIQFLNLAKGEVWMRIEFNTKKQIEPAEIEDYLESSVDMFVKAYAIN